MDIYAKWFTKAGLIYLILGVLLGVMIGIFPEWGQRLRFVHIHFNLLGFMTMMIAGVAYHVLPRFNANPVPWPDGVKYHFYLQNIGLLGMCGVHLAGGIWSGGELQALFVVFALLAGGGVSIMFYNLYMVLQPGKNSAAITITPNMKVGDILDKFPHTLQLFIASGFSTLNNPVARKTFAQIVSLEKACDKHGVNLNEFMQKLNAAVQGTSGSRPGNFGEKAAPLTQNPSHSSSLKNQAPVGKKIKKGELCALDVMVGSLINVYPKTKKVFEKHYGENCFSCPGQVFETVEQTANMHNLDPNQILKEINEVISISLKDA